MIITTEWGSVTLKGQTYGDSQKFALIVWDSNAAGTKGTRIYKVIKSNNHTVNLAADKYYLIEYYRRIHQSRVYHIYLEKGVNKQWILDGPIGGSPGTAVSKLIHVKSAPVIKPIIVPAPIIGVALTPRYMVVSPPDTNGNYSTSVREFSKPEDISGLTARGYLISQVANNMALAAPVKRSQARKPQLYKRQQRTGIPRQSWNRPQSISRQLIPKSDYFPRRLFNEPQQFQEGCSINTKCEDYFWWVGIIITQRSGPGGRDRVEKTRYQSGYLSRCERDIFIEYAKSFKTKSNFISISYKRYSPLAGFPNVKNGRTKPPTNCIGTVSPPPVNPPPVNPPPVIPADPYISEAQKQNLISRCSTINSQITSLENKWIKWKNDPQLSAATKSAISKGISTLEETKRKLTIISDKAIQNLFKVENYKTTLNKLNDFSAAVAALNRIDKTNIEESSSWWDDFLDKIRKIFDDLPSFDLPYLGSVSIGIIAIVILVLLMVVK